MKRTFILAILTIMFICTSATEPADSIADKPKDGIIGRVINYFSESNKKPVTHKMDFSIIGGPYYSSDTKLGLGVVAAGLYSTCPDDSITHVSNLSFKGKATTSAHFEIGVEGEHAFPQNKYIINYDLNFSSIKTKYWGIGYEMDSNDDNESEYRYLAIQGVSTFDFQIAKNLYVGPMLTIDYIDARSYQFPALWNGLPGHTFNWGIGASLRYDTRDNFTAPKKGVYIKLDQMFDWGWMGNDYPFKVNELTACAYGPLWRGATLAARMHWRVTWGDTPWGLMSYLGGNVTMRGYYEGRYRDKGAADICVELRQHVWRRNGVVAWAGVGSIFPKVSDINFHELLPNVGVGYRWEFKKNVNIRLDFGFGKHQSGFFFGINEAF